jgi:hypothetical protein
MRSVDFYSAERGMVMRVAEEHRDAEMRSLARRAGAQPPWSSGYGRRLVGQLALLLVSLGGRLVRYGLPPYRPAREQLS